MNTTSAAPELVRPGILILLDDLLRRRASCFTDIIEGREVRALLAKYFIITMALSAFYGLTMGGATLVTDGQKGLMQMLSSGLKVPILYIVTTLICFPVLYVVIVLMGSRMSFLQTLTTIMLSLALNSLLLASFAPIVWFFTVTGSDYSFLKLLHVAVMGISGAGGMISLWHGLTAACEKSDVYPKQAVRILQLWMLVFAFVGTQMAWSLRPFVGAPGQPFEIIRSDREGNFYKAVGQGVMDLVK